MDLDLRSVFQQPVDVEGVAELVDGPARYLFWAQREFCVRQDSDLRIINLGQVTISLTGDDRLPLAHEVSLPP